MLLGVQVPLGWRLWGFFASITAAVLLLAGSATAAPLGYFSPATEQQYYSVAAGPGNASWVRFFLWWKDIQRSDGTYNWGPYDRAYNEALRVGLRPQLALCGCANPPDTQSEWSRWEEFVSRAVGRYPQAMFEAWNEPNIGTFWDGAPNPTEYLRLLETVSTAAGSARTLPAGLAPVRSATFGRMTPMEFLTQVGVNDVTRLTERIDIHLYPPGEGLGLPPSEWVDSTVDLVDPLRQLVGPSEQIQVGEVGFNTSYLPSDGREALYADLTRQTFIRLKEKGVGPIFWFRLYSDANGSTAAYSVLQPDGTPLLPFWELAGLAAGTGADTEAPETSIDSGPSGRTTNASPSFTFSSSEPNSSFECRLDAGAWTSCTSPKSYQSLATGGHSFQVRATDAAGNTDPTPASRSFTVTTKKGGGKK